MKVNTTAIYSTELLHVKSPDLPEMFMVSMLDSSAFWKILACSYSEEEVNNVSPHFLQESNQLHAVCLDTYPPIAYMTSVSHLIVRLVHLYNDWQRDIKVVIVSPLKPTNSYWYTQIKCCMFKTLYILVKNCFLIFAPNW
jgi:hypothetical protein